MNPSKYLALLVFIGLIGCSNNNRLHSTHKSCQKLGVGEACSTESSGGDLNLELSDFESGQEYLVFVQSFQPFDMEKDYQIRFRMSSSFGSDPQPLWERHLMAEIHRHRPVAHFSKDLNSEISIPTQSLDPIEAYIPHLSDYWSESQGESIPRYFRTDDNPTLRGQLKQLDPIDVSPGVFESYMDSAYSSEPDYTETFQNESPCLDDVLSDIFEVLGRPLNLDRKPELDIYISRLEGEQGVIGLFNKLDRFELFRGKPIPDSNYGEIIYLSPHIQSQKICATTAHELQHLLSFDAKVLRQLPESERNEMNSMFKRGLESEHDGINEGFSYLIEILTGRYQNVFDLVIRPFLSDPHLATYSLPMANNSLEANFKSRGLNTVFLMNAMKKAGADLDWKKPATRRFLKELILSPHTGFDNLAKFLKVNRMSLFENFYINFATSLFQDDGRTGFLPAEQISDYGVAQGFRILARDAEVEEFDSFPNTFHPLEARIPLLNEAESWTLRPEGVSIFRLIVPENLNSRERETLRLHIQGGKTAYGSFLVRVR